MTKSSSTTRTKPHRIVRPPATLAALLASGKSFTDIAADIGAERETVAKWAKSDEIRLQVQKIRQEATQQAQLGIEALVEPAVSTTRNLLLSGRCEQCGRPPMEDKDLLKLLELVYDRGGLPKTTRQEVTATVETEVPDAQLDQEILKEASVILKEQGQLELAGQLEQVVKGNKKGRKKAE